MKSLKWNFIRGLLIGTVFTLLINSICLVTYYGLEYGIASGLHVFFINIGAIVISSIIVFILNKTININKILALIACLIVLVFSGIAIGSVFNKNLVEFLTFNYVMPGPTVLLPNILLWIIVWISVMATETKKIDNEKFNILTFSIGTMISGVIIAAIDMFLTGHILVFNNALQVNTTINNWIQLSCCIAIIIYYCNTIKKVLKK